MAASEPFPFNSLPEEVQVKVIEQYYGNQISIHVCHYDSEKKNFCFNGMLPLHLELVSRKMREESRKARTKKISTTVVISEENFLQKNMKVFAAKFKFAWLRRHIRCLKIAASSPPLQRNFSDRWVRFVQCLPNLETVEFSLPCAPMLAPLARQQFESLPQFQEWLGASIEAFVDPENSSAEIALTAEYQLRGLAEVMDATKENDKVRVDYRHFAVNPMDPRDCYFSMDVRFRVGTDGVKICHRIINSNEVHACWHGKGEPHVVLNWELAEESENRDAHDTSPATMITALEELIIEEMD